MIKYEQYLPPLPSLPSNMSSHYMLSLLQTAKDRYLWDGVFNSGSAVAPICYAIRDAAWEKARLDRGGVSNRARWTTHAMDAQDYICLAMWGGGVYLPTYVQYKLIADGDSSSISSVDAQALRHLWLQRIIDAVQASIA